MKHIMHSISPLFILALLVIIATGLGIIAKKTQQEETQALEKIAAVVDPCRHMVSNPKIEKELHAKSCVSLENIADADSSQVRKCIAARVLKQKFSETDPKNMCDDEYLKKKGKKIGVAPTVGILGKVIQEILAMVQGDAGAKPRAKSVDHPVVDEHVHEVSPSDTYPTAQPSVPGLTAGYLNP